LDALEILTLILITLYFVHEAISTDWMAFFQGMKDQWGSAMKELQEIQQQQRLQQIQMLEGQLGEEL